MSCVCLVVEIDTSAMTLTVPQFCLDELNAELHPSVRPGRVYMCRLLNALRDINSRSSARHITDDMRADIAWWIYLLQHYNGVSVIPSNVTIANPNLFACDACLSGCAAVCFY